MSNSRWRFIVGPLVTAAVGAAILLTDRFLVPVLSPAPGALMLFATLLAAYVGGMLSGLLSALLAIAVVTITLSEPGLLVTLQMDRFVRLVAYSAMLVVAATLLGYSQTRARRVLAQITAANRKLEISHVALNQVDYGVIVLDKDLRAQFMNQAVFKRTGLRERGPDEHPTYDEILRETAANAGYAIEPDQLNQFVAQRVAFVRSGNSTPVELRMADGSVARFKCLPLPDGGRMLTYTDVTDLTRKNDELGVVRAALDEVEEGVVLLDRDMRMHFMNRAIREIGGHREYAPGERPSFAELLDEVRAHSAYAVPDDQLDAYVAQRVEYVRSGNPNPIDLRMADGKVLRFKCNVLPDGGRMLIYANVTDLVRNAEQLEKLATTDGMTGLHNRRHFMKLAEAE